MEKACGPGSAMGQALYRKYRSKSLDEIVGQEHITDTLRQALKSGKISHAYLFTGPRGTGKTSIGRILAHEINGLEYKHEDNHIDIIEIDAASNRGIDEIRDLREKVHSAPISAKYKVYIIDEVHMLTTPAFNALLKTLEEPPEHVVFILATTEAHKLPDTIISRTQRHTFRPVEQAKVIKHLKHIAKEEKITITDEALELLAAHGGGSFRDSISLLDQAGAAGKKIDLDEAEKLLGVPPKKQLATLLASLSANDISGTLNSVQHLVGQGYPAGAIAKQLGDELRAQLIAGKSALSAETQLTLLRDLLDVAPAHEPVRVLELSLLGAMGSALSAAAPVQASAPTPRSTPATPTTTPSPRPAANNTPGPEPTKSQPTTETEPIDIVNPPIPAGTAALDATIWPEILGALKAKYNTLYGVMRMAVPEFEPGLLRLKFQFAFHQKRMHEAKHRAIVGDIITSLTGQAVAIECIHDKNATPGSAPASTTSTPATPAPAQDPAALSTISNIFGGGELLES